MNIANIVNALFIFLLRSGGAGVAVLFTLLVSRYLETDTAAEFLLFFNISTIAAVCFRWGMDEVIVRRVAAASYSGRRLLSKRLVALSHHRVLIWTAVAMISTAPLFTPQVKFILKGIEAKGFIVAILASALIALIATAARVHQGAGRINLATFLLNICVPLLSLTGLLLCVAVDFQPSATNLISMYALIAVLAYLFVVSRDYGYPCSLIKNHTTFRTCLDSEDDKQAANKLGGVVLAQQALLWGSFLLIPFIYDDATYKGFIVAQKVSTLISLVMLAINFTFSGRFAFLHVNKKFYELRKMVKYSCFALLISSIFIFIVVIYLHEFIFSFANIYKDMTTVLFILLIGQVFFSLSSLFAVVLSMCNDEKFLLTAQGGVNTFGFMLLLSTSFVAPIEIACVSFIASYLLLSIILGLRVVSITSLRTSEFA